VWATHLAVYDDNQDGLLSDYDVGLWGADGLVASATVEEGTSSQLAGSWRIVDIGRVQLEAGSRYLVGAVNNKNARWRAQRDSCEGFPGDALCELLGVPAEMPLPDVDQYYWLINPGDIPPQPAQSLIPATSHIDFFTLNFGVMPLYSDATGLQAPDEPLLVFGLFAGATVFIEVPEASTASLGIAAMFGAGGLTARWRR
jgi:hypothetical protein